MASIQLTRPDGSVFLIIERDRENGWYYQRWIGTQTLSTVMDGGLAFLELMRQDTCHRLLSDQRELHGRYDDAREWIEQVGVPLMRDAGVRCIAQVLSAEAYASTATEEMGRSLGSRFELGQFGDAEEARRWLSSCT